MLEIYTDRELEKEISEYDNYSRYSGFAKRIEEKVRREPKKNLPKRG